MMNLSLSPPYIYTSDIIGIVESAAPISSILGKNGANAGQKIMKRAVKIVDRGMKMVELTLWSEVADRVTEAVKKKRDREGGFFILQGFVSNE